MNVFIYIVSDLYMWVGILIAFLYILRGGKCYKGIILGWGLCILGSFIASSFFPSIAYSHNDYYFRFFPEAIVLPPVVILGWFPIILVVIIAWALRKTIINYYPQSQFWGANPKRKKTRLYLYIGLFYILLGLVMALLLTADKIGGNRTLLLYKTDHKALLEACRELADQHSKGRIDPNRPMFEQYPKIITGLDPRRIGIDQDGFVDITLSLNLRYGVVAFPEDYEGTVGEKMYSDKSWRIELLKGLLYYDEDFKMHPENKKKVEELLKKRKE
jgi:hypothetical protein